MARRGFNSIFNPAAVQAISDLPFDLNSPYIPEQFKNQATGLRQNAIDAYNAETNMVSRHPLASGLFGLLLGGPVGAMALPSIGKNMETRGKRSVLEAYKAGIEDLYKAQEAQDKMIMPRTEAAITNTLFNNRGYQSLVPQGGIASREFLQNGLDSGFGNEVGAESAKQLSGVQALETIRNLGYLNSLAGGNIPGLPDPRGGQAPVSNDEPIQLRGEMINPTLQAGVQAQAPVDESRLRPIMYTPAKVIEERTRAIGDIIKSAPNSASNLYKAPSEVSQNEASAASSNAMAQIRQRLLEAGYPEAVVQNLKEFNPSQPQLPPVGAVDTLYDLLSALQTEQSKPSFFGMGGPNPQTIQTIQGLIDMIQRTYNLGGNTPQAPGSQLPQPARGGAAKTTKYGVTY